MIEVPEQAGEKSSAEIYALNRDEKVDRGSGASRRRILCRDLCTKQGCGGRSRFRSKPEKNPLPQGWEGRRRPECKTETETNEKAGGYLIKSKHPPEKIQPFVSEHGTLLIYSPPFYSRQNVFLQNQVSTWSLYITLANLNIYPRR